MQMLDENHLLLKYASEDVIVMKTAENSSQLSLFVFYNIVTTEVSYLNFYSCFDLSFFYYN